jgi:BirA family biotin operon repressor/biotin-[acetyl-CoA-carboxylase] ligase
VAEASARHGDVHVAEEQSAGRGRRGRGWASARGEGLYLSLVLLPSAVPHPAALTMGAGLAVLEAVRTLGARGARLKWPNDVLVDGAKLAGILVESRGLERARPHAVVGIGLNVRQHAFPAALEAERSVTSLARLGLEVTLGTALEAVLGPLARRMEEACARPEASARDYGAALGLLGTAVRLVQGRGEARGRLASLALDGIVLDHDGAAFSRHPLEHVQGLERMLERMEEGAEGARSLD